MICDCDRGAYCHGHALTDFFTSEIVNECAGEFEQNRLDAMSVACATEGFDEDDEEGIVAAAEDSEVAPPPRFNAETEAVNETVRSEAANVHQERPAWLPSWVSLIAIMRGALYPVFWEMFAGKAG